MRVPESVIRDSRRGTWILTFRRPHHVQRRPGLVRPPAVDEVPKIPPFTPFVMLTPIATVLGISLSVTIACWDLLH